MAGGYTWSYADASGAEVTGEPTTATAFPTQADAETWFSESWQDLADADVASVTLHRDGEVVYGPMSLEAS